MSNKLNRDLDEIAEIFGDISLKMLRNCTGNGAEGITGPDEREQLALAVSDRIAAEVKAGIIKYDKLNPYLRPALDLYLNSSLKKEIGTNEQRGRARQLLKILKEQERAEQIALYGYADDEDGE